MSVPTRALGKNGPQVTAIGFGFMGLSTYYGDVPSDEDRLKLIDHIYESGQRFWDTAEMYGDSEELIGKWFKQNPEKRKNVFLATKFGYLQEADGSFAAHNEPEYIKRACDGSLKKLNTDYIDLYYVHRVDPNVAIELTVRELQKLKAQGKIRHLGLSEVSSETLRRAHAVEPIAAVQLEYSPFTLDVESPSTNLLKTCKELGVALVAYSPLCRGFLSGRYKSPADFSPNDIRTWLPRFSAENFGKNLELLALLEAVARRKSCTTSQLVLAWLLKQDEVVIPIPGTKSQKYFDENMGALQVVISDEEDAEIRKAVNNADVGGGRYTDNLGYLYVDTVPLKE